MLDTIKWLEGMGNDVAPFAMEHRENLPSQFAGFFPSFVQTEKVSFGMAGLKTLGRMFYSFEAKRKMNLLIEAFRPDVCHLHNIYTQLSPSIIDALRDHKIPTVTTIHDHSLVSPAYNVTVRADTPDYANMSLWQAAKSHFHKDSWVASLAQKAVFDFHKWLRVYKRGVDIFITPTNYLKGKMISAGFSDKQVIVLPYGIDATGPVPVFDHKNYVLFVGRLSLEKGVHVLIEAAAKMPHVNFVIVGTGPEETLLHQLADGRANIAFTGFQTGDALAKLYAEAMCVVVPSVVHETFSLTILEAMKYGRPVIASRAGGIAEVVADRTTGYLVDAFDVPGLIESIERLANNEHTWLSMAHASFQRVKKDFSLEKHHVGLLDIYRRARDMKSGIDF